ncbi:MAG: hypothetical protein LBQ28_09175 [Prevotellaceae bacterium]|jgi:hypothetical protein|nr:hypothetical protein [Prevotellaceae bacterium]
MAIVVFDINFKTNGKNPLPGIAKDTDKANKSLLTFGDRLRRIGTLSFGINAISTAFSKLTNHITQCTEAYKLQAVTETRLATIMRKTMDALPFEIDSIKKLASEQQKLGVIGDEIQLSGAQELATYLTKATSIRKLLPAMNDMLAQQYGLNATQEQAVAIAQMMGKVLDGQVGALSRYGYRFDDAQEKILKFGNEEQRVAMLAQVITQYVGGVNAALAQTPEGKLKQHANKVGDIREEWGKLFISIQSAILPLREKISDFFQKLASWFEAHREKVQEIVSGIVNFLSGVFSTVANFVRNNITAIMNFAKAFLVLKVYTVAYSLAVKVCAIAMALWKGIVQACQFVMIAFRFGLQTATRLMWGFNAAIKANPIGLLIGVVTAAITAFALFRKRTNETTKALNDAKKVASDYYAQERTQLDMMFMKLRQTNPKSKERNSLVNELMQMYPELNRQQLEELRNTNNLATAYSTLSGNIVRNSQIKARESLINAAYSDPDVMDIENRMLSVLNETEKNEKGQYLYRSIGGDNTVEGLELKEEWINEDEFKKRLIDDRLGMYSDQIYRYPEKTNKYILKMKEVNKLLGQIDGFIGSNNGNGNGGNSGGANPLETLATEITSGGKGVKNFYINIENLLRENTNIFQSSQDNPETASDFLNKLSYALQDVVNDANYEAN